MGSCADGVKSGVAEWVNRNMLRQYGNMKRKKNEEFVKKIDLSETEGPRKRRMPVVIWKDRVKEYMYDI